MVVCLDISCGLFFIALCVEQYLIILLLQNNFKQKENSITEID